MQLYVPCGVLRNNNFTVVVAHQTASGGLWTRGSQECWGIQSCRDMVSAHQASLACRASVDGAAAAPPQLLTVLHPLSGKLPQGATSYIFQSSLLYVKYTYKQPSSIPRGSYYDRGMLTIYFCLFFSAFFSFQTCFNCSHPWIIS